MERMSKKGRKGGEGGYELAIKVEDGGRGDEGSRWVILHDEGDRGGEGGDC